MIDFTKLERYVENNRIEAKKAQGGLPKSIWETYSAFANTLGGVILLGVEETEDKSLSPVKLDNPQALVDEFWQLINDEKIASVNILTDENVKIIGVHGEKIVAIEVPKADRKDKPVYVGGSIYTGTYRRNGEGDYRCTRESVDAMRQDSFVHDKDIKMLVWSGIDDIDESSLYGFLGECDMHRGGAKEYDDLQNAEFLMDIGAFAADEHGKVHLTAAGLLMFGKKTSILREYPHFLLEYREASDGDEHIISGENIYRFYNEVCGELDKAELLNNYDADIKIAVREAFVNSLLHADYFVAGGVKIAVTADKIEFSNPGTLRIDADNAFVQGVFDPRNGTLIRIFRKIKPNSGNGHGLLGIKQIFRANNLVVPMFYEEFMPERTTLVFDFKRPDARKSGGAESGGSEGTAAAGSMVLQKIKELYYRDLIIDYITEKSSCGFDELCKLLDGDAALATRILEGLTAEQLITKNGTYKLKI